MGLWLRSRNQVLILTIEASGITKARKSTTSSQKCESDANLFRRFPRHGASRIRTRGQTINREYYLEVLFRLRDAVRKKRPDICSEKDWQFHHNNAPAHSAQVIKDLLTESNTALVRQPPYSPDLAPCDFWLFPKLEKGRDFSHVRTLWKKRRQSSGAFQRRSSRGSSKSGRDAAKSVCTWKRSILKKIK